MNTDFLPHIEKRLNEMASENLTFAHYSSAEAISNIIKTKSFWMRNCCVMNDTSEFEHGLNFVLNFFVNDGDVRNRFIDAVSKVCGFETSKTIQNIVRGLQNFRKEKIYIASFTEHNKETETNGRLSMWRGYGQHQSKAALVLNKLPMSDSSDYFIAPVCYFTKEDFDNHIDDISLNLIQNSVTTSNAGLFINDLLTSLLVYSVTLKNIDFKEEREWRIIFIDQFLGLYDREILQKDVVTINGIPQVIFKISLNASTLDTNLHLVTLLDRVIIGPSNYGEVIKEAISINLMNSGIDQTVVFISETPLRSIS